jgi:hypothetical protein
VRDVVQLFLGLRKRHVEDTFACLGARQQELQGKRRFADTGIALQQIEPVDRQTAAEDIVKAFDTG